MADNNINNTGLFDRLRRLFSTDVIIRNVGGNQLKVTDVDKMIENTGWDKEFYLARYESYRKSQLITNIPNREELLKLAPKNSYFVESEGYDYCENTPILTFTK